MSLSRPKMEATHALITPPRVLIVSRYLGLSKLCKKSGRCPHGPNRHCGCYSKLPAERCAVLTSQPSIGKRFAPPHTRIHKFRRSGKANKAPASVEQPAYLAKAWGQNERNSKAAARSSLSLTNIRQRHDENLQFAVLAPRFGVETE